MEDSHQHFVGKVAQKAIVEKDGAVLVCLGNGDSVWEFPGGRLHGDEAPADGVAREIREELDIVVSQPKPFHACRSFHAKSQQWNTLIAYVCTQVGGEVRIDTTELKEARWITRDELATLPMFEDCREVADVYLRQ